MTLSLKVGSYYRRRDGIVVGPVRRNNNPQFPFQAGGLTYQENGAWATPLRKYYNDLISIAPNPAKKKAKAGMVTRWMFAIYCPRTRDAFTSCSNNYKKAAASRREHKEYKYKCGPITKIQIAGPK